LKGLILGLSNGVVCLMYCAPVLVPYFLGEGNKVRKNYTYLGAFLLGRMIGYLLFGYVAWVVNQVFYNAIRYREAVFGGIYIVLSIAMLIYGLSNRETPCAAKSLKKHSLRLFTKKEWFVPVCLGFLTGLNLCPPFILAFVEASNAGGVFQSIFFFFTFFLGTSLYFIPTPLFGALNKHVQLKMIGKAAAVVVAGYYFYTGIILFIGGIKAI